MTIVQQIPVGINYTLHIKRGLVYIVYSDVAGTGDHNKYNYKQTI